MIITSKAIGVAMPKEFAQSDRRDSLRRFDSASTTAATITKIAERSSTRMLIAKTKLNAGQANSRAPIPLRIVWTTFKEIQFEITG